MLRRWRAQSSGDGYLFPGPDGEGHITEVKGAWGRVTRAAKLRGFRFHHLRHTFCTWLALATVPAAAIQKLAGHRNLATTQRYMEAADEHQRAAVARLAPPTVRRAA